MVKLPRWVPKVARPSNPEYASAWDHMSDNEKRWSFLVDVLIVFGASLLIWLVFR